MLDTEGRSELRDTRPSVPPRWALWTGAATPTVLIVGWIVAPRLQPPGYDPLQETISVLSGLGAQDRWFMTAALYLVAVCHVLTAIGLRGIHPAARAIIVLAGAAGFGVAYFPQPAGGSAFDHMSCAVAGAVLLTLWPFVMALWRPSVPLLSSADWAAKLTGREGCIAAGCIIAVSALAMYVTAQLGLYLGLTERLCTGLQSLLPLLMVIGLRRTAAAPARVELSGTEDVGSR